MSRLDKLQCARQTGSQCSSQNIQWCAGHSDSVHVNPTPHIFVISQPKWLKFATFQLSGSFRDLDRRLSKYLDMCQNILTKSSIG